MDRLYEQTAISNNPKTSSSYGIIPLSQSSTIYQVLGYQAYLWPWINGQPNTNSNTGPVNIIFLNKNKGQVESELIFNTNGAWNGAGQGNNENGLHGNSPSSLTWTSANMFTNDQLYKGGFFTSRYHMLVFDGGHDYNYNMDWSYGSSHHEHWDWLAFNHFIDNNGWDTGRDYALNSVTNYLGWNWYTSQNFNNAISGYFSGTTYEIYMS